MMDLAELLDIISRKFPVIGVAASIIMVVVCAYTIGANISNPLGLLPAAGILLLILAVTWLLRRAVASLPDPAELKPPDEAPPGSVDEIGDAHR